MAQEQPKITPETISKTADTINHRLAEWRESLEPLGVRVQDYDPENGVFTLTPLEPVPPFTTLRLNIDPEVARELIESLVLDTLAVDDGNN